MIIAPFYHNLLCLLAYGALLSYICTRVIRIVMLDGSMRTFKYGSTVGLSATKKPIPVLMQNLGPVVRYTPILLPNHFMEYIGSQQQIQGRPLPVLPTLTSTIDPPDTDLGTGTVTRSDQGIVTYNLSIKKNEENHKIVVVYGLDRNWVNQLCNSEDVLYLFSGGYSGMAILPTSAQNQYAIDITVADEINFSVREKIPIMVLSVNSIGRLNCVCIKLLDRYGASETVFDQMEDNSMLREVRVLYAEDVEILPNSIKISGRRYVDYSTYDEESQRCVVCLSRPMETVIIPCKHSSCCKGCIREVRNAKCPICRVAMSGYLSKEDI